MKGKTRAWVKVAIAVAVLALLPPATAAATPVSVMVSGAISGTYFINAELVAAGVNFLSKEAVPGAQASHGGYLAPDGTLYVGGFNGGGLQIFKRQNGSWSLQGTVGMGRAPMISAVGLKLPEQDPHDGLLSLNDTSTGSEYYYNMASAAVEQRIYRMSGLCDTSYSASGEAWSSGYGAIFHWISPLPGVPLLDPVGSKWGESSRHSDAFNGLDGNEYIVIAQGSGDLLFIRVADNSVAKRVHVADGELYGVAVFQGIWAVASNASNGDLIFLELGSGAQLNPQVIGVIPGTQVNGGFAADLGGVGFVSVGGAWTRN